MMESQKNHSAICQKGQTFNRQSICWIRTGLVSYLSFPTKSRFFDWPVLWGALRSLNKGFVLLFFLGHPFQVCVSAKPKATPRFGAPPIGHIPIAPCEHQISQLALRIRIPRAATDRSGRCSDLALAPLNTQTEVPQKGDSDPIISGFWGSMFICRANCLTCLVLHDSSLAHKMTWTSKAMKPFGNLKRPGPTWLQKVGFGQLRPTQVTLRTCQFAHFKGPSTNTPS